MVVQHFLCKVIISETTSKGVLSQERAKMEAK